MTKKDFEKYLNEQFREIPLEEQERLLIKMEREWIPSILKRKLEKYTMCDSCKKYSLTKRFKTITIKNRRIETTYRDAGYGDDDMIGEVEYLYYYLVCPICGYEKNIKVNILELYGKEEEKVKLFLQTDTRINFSISFLNFVFKFHSFL